MKKAYYATQEALKLCERRGVSLKDIPETSSLKMPVWFFIPIFRLLYKFNKSMQRFTAHAANSVEECRYNYNHILDSARELGVSIPYMEELKQYLT